MLRKGVIFTTIAITLLFIYGLNISISPIERADETIKVAISIDILRTIISPVINGVGEIYSIVSERVEPHGFVLTPSIVSNVSKSDLIIVTGHMEWEKKLIEEIAEIKGIEADLTFIDLSKLSGLRILELNGEKNLHGFWLLPDNALLIAKEVKERISRIRPDISQKIEENYEEFKRRVLTLKNFLNRILDKYDIYGRDVIIGFYAEQYVAEAIGLRVASALIGEGESIRPETLRNIYEGLKSGKYACIIVSDVAVLVENTKEAIKEISRESSCPVAFVLTVSSGGLQEYDMVMYYNAGQICCALLTQPRQLLSSSDMYLPIIIALLTIIALETIFLVRRRVK
ncbi:MAG: zinc ABC transporter substrate-binding protein [Candidatus Bathyarchaeia archaeon]|nr:metal ABC transporter substrate-binding protein [Candidatus Bathyarchaeota archaeon]